MFQQLLAQITLCSVVSQVSLWGKITWQRPKVWTKKRGVLEVLRNEDTVCTLAVLLSTCDQLSC